MRIDGNILGKMHNSLGKSLTFFVWRGIQVARTYAKPPYSDTPGQSGQRSLFKTLMLLFEDLYSIGLKAVWKKQAIHMTPYNVLMSVNLKEQKINPGFESFILAKGSLAVTDGVTGDYKVSTHDLTISWPTTLIGDQLATDIMNCVVYDEETLKFFPVIITNSRSSGTKTTSITLANPGKTVIYVWFTQALGTSLEKISDNTMSEITTS